MSTPAALEAGLGGALPFATLLCRYADQPDEEPRSRFEYERMMSGEFPNAAHYWSNVSDGQLSLEGSRVYGWYALPRREEEYRLPNSMIPDLARLLDDCMAAADADVYLPAFEGINVQVNGVLGGVMNLGGIATVGSSTRDGVERTYNVIAYHKDRLGWIPANRRHVAPIGTSTVTLDPVNRLRGNDDRHVMLGTGVPPGNRSGL